jgi:hypothetical protein
MRLIRHPAAAFLAALPLVFSALASAHDSQELTTELRAAKRLEEGRDTFRHATFGDEDFWGGVLGLHRAIAGAANGGVGPGVSPKTALKVGLKNDVDALPGRVRRALRARDLDLDDPAVTLTLLKLDAVVGLTGFFDKSGRLSSVGI